MNSIVQIKEDSDGGLLITTVDKYAVAEITASVIKAIKPESIEGLRRAIANFDIKNVHTVRALDDARDGLANAEILVARLSPDEAKQLANQIYVHLAFKMADSR
jgi:hypothetical protein